MSASGEQAPARRAPVRLPDGRRQAALDVAREIRFHIEQCTDDLVAGGMTPAAARAEAGRRFGDPDATAEECLAIEGARQEGLRRRERWATVRQDVAYAFRTLGRAPRFTLAVVLTLGLAVGAATAMFGVVDAVLLRGLPLPEAHRVVALVPHVGGEARGGSPGLLAAWRAGTRGLQSIAGVETRHLTLLGQEGAERVAALAVSRGFFATLGASPLHGRALDDADDRPGAARVVVLRERLWTRRFAGDRAVLGQAITLDGTAHTVVGVMPDGVADGLGDPELWVPLALPASQDGNFTPYLTLVGRLAPGATADAAERELAALARGLGAAAADDGVYPAVQVTALDRHLGAGYRTPLLLMLAAVGVVLLIGCANVATLVLVRSVGRARELAVRAALGAGRARLVRQLLTEHVVLGTLAALVALPIAVAGTRALVAMAPLELPRLAHAGLDPRALAVAVALGLATSLLCGIAPALHQRGLAVGTSLRGGRGGTDVRGDRWRHALVGAEVALAVVLLAGAGLFVRSAFALGRVRTGFDAARVQTARLALPRRDYPELPRMVATYERMLDAARQAPGVASAALVSRVPLGGSRTGVDVAIADGTGARAPVSTAFRIASPGYFGAIGIPLLAGRDLRASDDAGATPVAVVNATLARRLAGPGGVGTIVGRRFASDNGAFRAADGAPRTIEIVGVVGDVLDEGPRGVPQPEFYAPMGQVSQEPWDYWIGRELLLVVRTTGDAASVVPALRRAVAGIDARVPLYDVRTTGERLAESLAVERFSTRLLVLLGFAGLALAALGIHAVVAYTASRRARDVGVRMALGATVPQVVSHAVRHGMQPVVAGLMAGLGLAIVVARAARGLLFGVSPLDPPSLVLATLLLGGVALLACLGPARRLARTDPVAALRSD